MLSRGFSSFPVLVICLYDFIQAYIFIVVTRVRIFFRQGKLYCVLRAMMNTRYAGLTVFRGMNGLLPIKTDCADGADPCADSAADAVFRYAVHIPPDFGTGPHIKKFLAPVAVFLRDRLFPMPAPVNIGFDCRQMCLDFLFRKQGGFFVYIESGQERRKIIPILDPEAAAEYYAVCMKTDKRRFGGLFEKH